MMRDRIARRVAFDGPPPVACWLHQGLRAGFEVAFFSTVPTGLRVEGTTTGFQDGNAWVVTYEVDLDETWKTVRAAVTTRIGAGSTQHVVESDGQGHWRVDGEPSPGLDGCLDVDLESSAMTNSFPVHRLSLAVGHRAEVPAAYVQLTGDVEPLHQRYQRREDRGGRLTYDYAAPAFEFESQLVYDRSGLVLEYPGIATRVG